MSAVPSGLTIDRARWRQPLVALALLIAVILLLYRDTALGMVGIWNRSDTFAHAFLVPPISLWLVWRRRAEIAALQPRPMPWMLLPMLGAAAAWLLSDLVAVNAGTHFALVAMIVIAVPTVLGPAVAKAMLFPLGFLFFSVPFGEFLLPVLMEHTADFTVFALQLTGIPVYREGLRFVIPSGSWSVVEACSGVRYLIASLMVGSLFAYLNYHTMWRRWVFVGVAIVVPIVANWLRAYMIVMIGHLSDNTLAVGVDHLVYGWLFFGIVISLMFMIGARWSEADPAVSPAPEGGPAAAASARFGPSPTAALAAAVLALPFVMLQLLDRPGDTAAPVVRLPSSLASGWARVGGEPAFEPRFVGPSATATARFASGSDEVGVYVAYYRAQSYERKLVGSHNVIVTAQDRDWNQLASTSRRVRLDGGGSVTVSAADLVEVTSRSATSARRLTVWKLYWVDDAFTSSDIVAKLHGAVGRLLGRGDDAAAIVVHAVGALPADNERALESFVAANLGPLRERLREARAGARASSLATLRITETGNRP